MLYISHNENKDALRLVCLLDKRQLCRYSVQSWLLEYLHVSVWQQRQLRAGLSINISVPGKLCQVADMASFLPADHVKS